MNKIVYFIFGIFLFIFAQDTCAQTPYSSQNFNLNNFFNPATSGFGINNKVQAIFRTQYEGAGSAYRTIGIAADFALVDEGFSAMTSVLLMQIFLAYNPSTRARTRTCTYST